LSHARLVSIVPANGINAAGDYAFADALPSSAWWQSFSGEYGIGVSNSSAHLTGAPIVQDVTLAALEDYVSITLGYPLDGGADAGTVGDAGIPLDGTNIFIVYLPPGRATIPGGFCGFHTPYPSVKSSIGDNVAVIVDSCLRLFPGQTDPAMTTNDASHEIAEAATDPLLNAWRLPAPSPFSPPTQSAWMWASSAVFEVGDFCEGARWVDPGSNTEYQRIFSASAAADGGDPCLPALGQPYFSVSSDADWHAVSPGGSVDIPITGWSTGPVADWNINPHLVNGSPALLSMAADAGLETLTSPLGSFCNRPLINNGATATLHVTVPSSAVSGEIAVFSIHSYRQTASCAVQPLPDAYHQWPVGVYVQ
jgi:hypothetical protein